MTGLGNDRSVGADPRRVMRKDLFEKFAGVMASGTSRKRQVRGGQRHTRSDSVASIMTTGTPA